jgi:hypothetical protein
MLNFRIAMLRFRSVTAIILTLILPMYNVSAQEGTETPSEKIVFISPQPGQILQGIVSIIVEVAMDTTVSGDLSFAYHNDTSQTWFLIEEIQTIDQPNLQLDWDTTKITDGDYAIRFVVNTAPDKEIIVISGLRVRNYTPVETETPQPTFTPAPQDTPIPTITPTRTSTMIAPTVTALPPNPAQITSGDIWNSISKGALFAVGAFASFGIYQFIITRRRKKD